MVFSVYIKAANTVLSVKEVQVEAVAEEEGKQLALQHVVVPFNCCVIVERRNSRKFSRIIKRWSEFYDP